MPLMWTDLLVEDLRQQQTNLQNQYQRMHNRLQLSTGLNTALLPAFGASAAAAGAGNLQTAWLIAFPVAGILLSSLGYATGRADRRLVELYRGQISRTARELLHLAEPAKPYDQWAHAGRETDDLRRLLEPDQPPPSTRLRVTRLPYQLALSFLSAWFVVLIVFAAVAIA
jgi:hypothetical protein